MKKEKKANHSLERTPLGSSICIDSWQCYAAGIGLLLVGVILFLDSIRMVERKITSSPQPNPPER